MVLIFVHPRHVRLHQFKTHAREGLRSSHMARIVALTCMLPKPLVCTQSKDIYSNPVRKYTLTFHHSNHPKATPCSQSTLPFRPSFPSSTSVLLTLRPSTV
jgi:hypothetical protein